MNSNYMANGKVNEENLKRVESSKNSGKPVVSFTKEPVRYICNEAFYAARPEGFPKEFDPVLAAGYGLEAGDAAANYCKEVVYPNVVKPVAENMGVNFSLKNAAYTGLALVGLVLAKRLLNPKKAIQYIKDHPDMVAGALGVMSSASRVAVKTIQEERQKEFLQNNYGIKN